MSDPNEKERIKFLRLSKMANGGVFSLADEVIRLEDKIDAIPNFSDVIEQIKGKDGEDSMVPGPQGVQGEKGEKGDTGDSIVGPKGEDGRDGADGKDAEAPLFELEKELPKMGKPVRDGLESLKDDDRLDISAIKGVDASNNKLSDALEKRAIGIVDQRTSFLINKVSNLQRKVDETVASGSGTVTSVAAITLGTTGIDLSSTVANGTTTPVITLQVPTASAANRGALSSADWSTFNAKAPALGADDNYVTDAQLVIIGNTSGTNTGDNATNSQYSGLAASKADLASPTFTGTVTIPTPFTLGAVSVLPTGTELNFVDGVTSAIQTQLNAKAPLASPTFTGTVTIPETPSNATDAASKGYVDGVAQGLSVKGSVLLATAAALPTNTYLLGVITVTATGTLTVDGTVTALNDRILVKDESSALKNGIYKVTTAGAIGVAAVLTRSTDMDVSAEFPGAFVFVETGTVNAAAGFVCTNSTNPNVGTDAINFTQFSGAGEITAGVGLTKTGNTLDADSASTTAVGVVELATDIETNTGTDTTRAITPSNLEAWTGSAQITTVGTLASPVMTTPSLGTPSALVLTNATGLPVAGITASTVTALGVGSIELGHASDTTIARVGAGVISVEGVTIPSISSTSTLTNKRITKRVVTTTDDATAVIDVDVTDVYELTAVANATTISTTGTPTDGQMIVIRIKDAGAAKALTWDAIFVAIGVTLPTTTVLGKWHYIGCTYNTAATKWHAIAVAAQA
jgi:hypothetical protein